MGARAQDDTIETQTSHNSSPRSVGEKAVPRGSDGSEATNPRGWSWALVIKMPAFYSWPVTVSLHNIGQVIQILIIFRDTEHPQLQMKPEGAAGAQHG